MNIHATFGSDSGSAKIWQPFRPVQYLGSKLRVLDEIGSAVRTLVRPGANVVDLFTGTTVVAQQLAAADMRVTAVDTQRYAHIFATAMLGVSRKEGEGLDGRAIATSALEASPSGGTERWRVAEKLEANAIDAQDAVALRRVYSMLPLSWRGPVSSDVTHSFVTVYAGTYFGIRQAREIDVLRATIHDMENNGLLSDWQSAVALTGLMHAASAVVHSAGKHFAQPLGEGSGNAKFLNARLLSDRSISVSERFIEGCDLAAAVPFNALNGHQAVRSLAEEQVLSPSKYTQLYYLDPPYTAQQYSRFYHILETISEGGAPKLPPAEHLSTGLYPVDRYKSAFSSRRKAPVAMEALLSEIARQGASALVSYSMSAAGSNGNARMVTLEKLLTMCSRSFGTSRVESFQMSHRYRQFNSAENANSMRNDGEVLILCKSV